MPRTENPTDLTREQLVEAFRKMSQIRRAEEVVGRAYQMQKFSGFCHLYIGQEAVAAGLELALRPDDYVIGSYRSHGQAMARGVGVDPMMAEMLAKKTGSTGGRGGSMHVFDVDKGFYGGWGIVGAQIPLATGLGWGAKYHAKGQIAVCFFGEGAIHQGVFHEGLNHASIWDLPCVFIAENNKYAMGTEMSRINRQTDIQLKAVSYAMDHASINGQDIFDMYTGIKEAVDRARDQSRPTFVEVRTYRYRGHSMSDAAKYRTKAELAEEQQRDPIANLRADLLAMEMATDEELTAIDKEARQQAKDALTAAEAADFPADSTLFDYVLA